MIVFLNRKMNSLQILKHSALVSLLFRANCQQTIATKWNLKSLGKYTPGRSSAASVECGGAVPAPCR